jgi:cytidylate kinase
VGKPINIAIDGPASSGKGTVARLVAAQMGFAYIDTGAMFRAVALRAQQCGVAWSDEIKLRALIDAMKFTFIWRSPELRIVVDGGDVTESLRLEEIGRGASNVAVHSDVRSGLLQLQQELAAEGGVVMDGRDIGTVVLPSARLKIYLDASVQERAKRRTAEIRSKGEPVDEGRIAEEIALRDNQDRNRTIAPLIQSPDALYIDTTGRSPSDIAADIARRAKILMAQLA